MTSNCKIEIAFVYLKMNEACDAFEVFEDEIAEFEYEYLIDRDLSQDDCEFNVIRHCDDGSMLLCVTLPNGIRIVQRDNNWYYHCWADAERVNVKDDELCENMQLSNDIANECVMTEFWRRLLAENARVAEQEAEIAALKAELLELKLRPGGSEYKTAEEHFAKLAN